MCYWQYQYSLCTLLCCIVEQKSVISSLKGDTIIDEATATHRMSREGKMKALDFTLSGAYLLSRLPSILRPCLFSLSKLISSVYSKKLILPCLKQLNRRKHYQRKLLLNLYISFVSRIIFFLKGESMTNMVSTWFHTHATIKRLFQKCILQYCTNIMKLFFE